MVKKILILSTFMLITLFPNLNVNAIQVGQLNGLNITQNENGVNHQYSLMNDYFSYTQGTTRYIFSHSDNLMWKGISVSSANEYTYTTNLNYYFTNPCSSSDNVSYNQRIGFFFVNTDEYRLNTLNVVNNINGCSGYWTKEDSTYYYNQSCSLPAGSPILGSLYFSEPNLGSWQVSNYRIGIQDDFDVKCEVNTNALIDNNNANTQNIINNNNNNTQNIVDNQNQNTQDIINNQDSNTQDIIDNQNSNTDKEIESQKVCSIIDNSSIITKNVYLEESGSTSTSQSFGITDYIKVYNSDLKKLSTVGNSPSICFYTESKTLISCLQNRNLPIGEVDLPSNAYYIRASINYNTNAPQYELCSNGNQALTDALTSEDTPNTNQDLQDMQDKIASDTPITDLLTLPLTLISAYYSGINSSCSPYNFGSLLGTDIIFPCINLEQRLGSNLWLIIDSLCCIFLIYSIAMLFVHAFDNLTSLKDDFSDMYVPKHAGKHVGSGIDG